MRKHTPCRVINQSILWRYDNLYYASPDQSATGRGSSVSRTYGVCTDSNRIKWGGELAYCVTGSLDGSWSPFVYGVLICMCMILSGPGRPAHVNSCSPLLSSDMMAGVTPYRKVYPAPFASAFCERLFKKLINILL